MKFQTIIPLVVIAVALWAKYGANLLPAPEPDVPVVAPTVEMQGFVMPIKTKLAGHPQKASVVRALYRDWANVVERDGGAVLKSIGTLFAAHQSVSALMAKHPGFSGEPQVAAECNTAIEQAMGVTRNAEGKIDDQPLDAAKRARLVDVLRAISWAGT